VKKTSISGPVKHVLKNSNMANLLNQRFWMTIGSFMLIFLFTNSQAADSEYFNLDPKVRPDNNRFTPIVVTQGTLDEPLVFEVLEDGRVFLAERKGALKLYDPVDATVKTIGFLDVNTTGNKEQGLVGMTVDPDFEDNGWMYLYYLHPDEAKGVISRWNIKNNTLVANSEKVLLEFPAQRETCCHTGGGMAWNKEGDLYITIGNNTGNNITSHTDEREGRSSWDDQRGASNTNSLEGKILRIHPEPDGSYTIPPGNLFPVTTPNTLPEIYTMGHRNAWRVSVDSATGYVYWGEVGPDGREDTNQAPKGYDEFNQARGPGFFGWPYFVGEAAYPIMDYETNSPGEKKDPRSPTNLSPNNTGMIELPPVSPSFVYYPYDQTEKFPDLGTGGRSATGGPIYRRADFPNAERPWPAYFEGKWLAAEFSRRAIFLIAMDSQGDFQSLEKFLPDYRPVEPIDMKFGPTGDLYVLEYGGRWFQSSPEAKLVRISYEGGNRKPIAVASSDKIGGVPPFQVSLSSAGTEDFDFDVLEYRWEVIDAGGNVEVVEEPDAKVTLTSIGTYTARLTVTDSVGVSDTQSLPIVSGNEPPQVGIRLMGNQSFFFSEQPIEYAVQIEDAEDGSLSGGDIEATKVSFSIDRVDSNFDVEALRNLQADQSEASRFPVAQSLIAKGNCRACHLVDAQLVGPAFRMIADKYKNDDDALSNLTHKIVTGVRGVWGEVPMPPNGLVSEAEAKQILKYVLSLSNDDSSTLPLTGSYTPEEMGGATHQGPGRGGVQDPGVVLMRAVYSDRGDDFAASLTSQTITLLKPARLQMANADQMKGVVTGRFGSTVIHGAHVVFKDVDLTQIRQVDVSAFASSRQNQTGGVIELRLGGPAGELLGAGSLTAPEPNPPGGGRGRRGGFRRDPVHIVIREESGLKDLCLVFSNEKTDPEVTLMSVSRIEFLPELTENSNEGQSSPNF
jgi:cytochrome c